jgi:hypothetical protein
VKVWRLSSMYSVSSVVKVLRSYSITAFVDLP